ncbi:MAG TPA: hypothetical protein VKA92_13375, partial [Segetibacter sp.]|nr:hypothetical protein [Segetibacter sp.]
SGTQYLVQDDNAARYAEKWHTYTGKLLVNSILSDYLLWEADLTVLPDFADAVALKLHNLQNGNVRQAIKEAQSQKEL